MKYLIIDKKQRVKTERKLPYASSRMVEELEKENIEYDFVYNTELGFDFGREELVIKANDIDIREYTHILIRGHHLERHRDYETKAIIINYIDHLNSTGKTSIKVQNSESMKLFPYYNKILMAQICLQNDVPYLHTYYQTGGDYVVKQNMGYPHIIKEYAGVNDLRMIDGEKKVKKNVYLIEKEEDYNQEHLKDKDLRDFFIQEFAPGSEDIRTFVQNGKLIGGWKREAKEGFMTVSKGEYTMYNNPADEIKELAEKVANIFKADFIAVDFMYKDGMPFLQEISFHPGFKAYETKIEGEPINVAKAIIESF